ncbi:RsmB/NOP family class I SAM-dependent RNA methyltransferase [Effusibacillus lacus]|uniref:RNA methyltransferase n=1 Tax=Effusibacillus lacus TaxID=1348429 RepID=A0A292YGR2_9BACL|nr:RsmB/NOP family class I SAM-dependent RNA methyltransferase [Effusibacillus lacus]TCS75376.1 NOL1/NOP2/sun family putative RNA methylase [Effusibacillus lacus]GAX89807.1 RNA methyltransferase [Effusibacillus lacus]
MKLPTGFLNKMKEQLGDEYSLFVQSYERTRAAGVRANQLKISAAKLKELLPYLEEPVPWCRDGFYYNEEAVRPAKHPYYYSGLYYIQEPSAMLPAELLQVQPGSRVLDLCAAPGGKSIQLAARLGTEGLLVANDLHPQRAKVLLKNIERYGVVNAIVLNESPERLAQAFAGFFDKVLVDAPCSGEGMFRKEPEMANGWSQDEVAKYSEWQAAILDVVPLLLKPGGEIVYSTCTFSKEENEQQIQGFIEKYPEIKLLEMCRLWPHKVKGEGHFAAKLKQSGNRNLHGSRETLRVSSKPFSKDTLSKTAEQELDRCSQQVWGNPKKWRNWLPEGGTLVERSGHILWESNALPKLQGLKVLRSGWLLGTVEKGRFHPSSAYALGLPKEAALEAVQRCELSARDEQEKYTAIRYLRGETLQLEGKKWNKGWHLVTIDGYPLGWAKGAGNWLKNEFPPGWRWEDGEKR